MSGLLLKSFLWGMPEQATVWLLLKAFACSARKAALFRVDGLRERKEGLVGLWLNSNTRGEKWRCLVFMLDVLITRTYSPTLEGIINRCVWFLKKMFFYTYSRSFIPQDTERVHWKVWLITHEHFNRALCIFSHIGKSIMRAFIL